MFDKRWGWKRRFSWEEWEFPLCIWDDLEVDEVDSKLMLFGLLFYN